MKPLRPRYLEIEQTVQGLLEKYAVSSPPVDVEGIARQCGAQIQYEQFNKEIAGLLLRQPSMNIIAVEEKQSETRQRFTVAHELGHLLLHDAEELRVDKEFRMNIKPANSSTSDDVKEIEANVFAALLLMPTSFILRDLAGEGMDVESEKKVKALAKCYNVSPQAMTIRLANLRFSAKPVDR